MKKLLSRILALLLVLVIIVNISPIRGQASALPEVAGVVTKVIPFAKVVEPAALGLGGTIFCWVAAAIGVGFTVYGAVEAYNNFQDYSGMLETTIYYYPDGSWSYGVDMGFIERVRAFLFDTGVISTVANHLTTESVTRLVNYIGQFESAFNCRSYCYWYTINGTVVYFALAQSPVYLSNGNYAPIDGSVMWTLTFNGSTLIKSDGIITKFTDPGVPLNLFKGTAYDCSSICDVQLGEVAPLEISMPEAYPEWHTNARPATNPDTQEEITVLPIPLNPSADPETQIGTLTQPDIWQGSVADPMPDTGTDTDPDGSLSNTPWDAVKKWASDFFIPSGDITMYSLDLTELFPFCIPFDIFDLLSALRADPVAPVFELELDFGVTKAPITVDLSGWSDLASIVRILEVGLFCLGLALGTKELIGT